MQKERTRKPHPNPKPLEKLRIVDGGLLFPHGPNRLSYEVAVNTAAVLFALHLSVNSIVIEVGSVDHVERTDHHRQSLVFLKVCVVSDKH